MEMYTGQGRSKQVVKERIVLSSSASGFSIGFGSTGLNFELVLRTQHIKQILEL